ncbi:hypothetical protein MKW92_019909 [Papaver armeniacum]|nr:hypothetical protein MKW92_019909 [Papaver armeniacum]
MRHQLWVSLAFILGGGIVIFIGFVLLICYKLRVFQLLKQWVSRKRGLEFESSLQIRRFRLEQVEKATKSFGRDYLIGTGAFGKVYVGVFEDDRTLAVKRAHDNSFQCLQEFKNEVELISKVKHRNLVGLVGYCHEAGVKALVYEYVPNGSLLEYIVGRGGKTLSWRQRVNIAIGAAKGIAFLHEGVKPCIIHRDIKPSNILVGSSFEAKVSDFGLVKSGPTGDQSHVSSQVKGTPGYLDPAYCTSYHLSPLSDVFSFGVILLQLVAARPAVDTSSDRIPGHIIEWARPSIERGIVEDIIDVNLLAEPCNMQMMLKMGQLGLRCTVETPKNRPTMTQVAQELEEALITTDNYLMHVRNQPYHSKGSIKASMEELYKISDDHQTSQHELEISQSFVSIDGLKYQKFRLEEMDSVNSFASTNLRCVENNNVSIDVDLYENVNLKGINEEETSSSSTSTEDNETRLTRYN